ncbi:MAG TPA: AraC family transcriptional regulator [Chthoniobacterales bacterium]|nr:AraC family transcriptional regulator [Chthoniobacterales bacterium]
MTQKEENSLQELEARQKLIPWVPSATSYRMGWKALQAVRYRTMSEGVEYRLPPPARHGLVLTIRPAAKFYLRSEGVKRDRPLYPRSILVLPAESSVWQRWQGRMDALVIYLEPSVVARVVAETFELDPTRTVVPPLDGFSSPELFSTMSAVNAELRTGGLGGSLLAESFATLLAVHLIRHITGPRRKPASADGVLPNHKLRTVIEYIMENLGGSPTLDEMAALVHLSPYHFARQFKAATGSPPYQFVITHRIERAQHLLRTNGGLGLAEVAFRSGFANQSHFCLHFKRIAGVTPRRFRENATGRTILE